MIRPAKDAKPREKKQYALYIRRTGSIYQSMKQRRKKLGGTGDLPFTLGAFRIKVECFLGTPCVYCEQVLTVKNFSGDHRLPVERGGSWRLPNLRIICQSCNTAKGRMTGNEFMRLIILLRSFQPGVMKELLGRLKAGASVIRLRFLKR